MARKEFNVVVVPYRDSQFYNEYGPAVRDLQIIETLASMDEVARVTVVNRPVHIVELILKKKNIKSFSWKSEKVFFYNKISLDYKVVLQRRWANFAYRKYLKKVLHECHDPSKINLFIDFLPIGGILEIDKKSWFYWYDLIDNFVKHNRYSLAEKNEVRRKYKHVSSNARLVTGVTVNALSEIDNSVQKKIMPNGLFGKVDNDCSGHETYDFGFVGFITDKFDVGFVNNLAEAGYSIAIYGSSYDNKVVNNFHKNITYKGSFKYYQIGDIISTFKVGLLPYLKDRSHDESPLKMYEYLRFCRPCLASQKYDQIDNPYVLDYSNTEDIYLEIPYLITKSGSDEISSTIRDDMFLSKSVGKILKECIR